MCLELGIGPPPCLAQEKQIEFSGKKLFIADVKIEGNKRTRRHIIIRELDLKLGDTIAAADTSQVMEWNSNKVFNTLLFVKSKASLQLLEADTGQIIPVVLLVQVRERWYTFPNPIFELADRNFNEWWYLRNRDLSRTNYGLRFVQKNVRGRNEELRFIAQGGFTRSFGITYTIPYLTKRFSEGIRIGASFSTNKAIAYRTVGNQLQFIRLEDKDARQRFNASVAFSKRVGFFNNHLFFFDFNQNQIADTIASLNPRYFGNGRTRQKYFQLYYQYAFDRRNNRAYPLKGAYFAAVFNQFGFTKWEDLHITSLRVKAALYKDLGRGFYAASGADVEVSTPARQNYYQHRSLGYSGRLVRGYEKNVIEGYRPALCRNSLKYQLLKREYHSKYVPLEQFSTIPLAIYLKAHADGGFVANPYVFDENKRLTNTWLGGAGLGLDVVTYYDVVLRFEYSMNRHGEKGFFLSFEADL